MFCVQRPSSVRHKALMRSHSAEKMSEPADEHAHGAPARLGWARLAGVGGDRNVARQAQFIRNGVRFLTTNSDIAFMIAEASRVTGELRKALGA